MSVFGDEVTDYLNNIDNQLDRVATALEQLVGFLTSPPVVVYAQASRAPATGFERYPVRHLPLIPAQPRDPKPSTITC